MGMMGKLKEAQQKIENTKRELDAVLVEEKTDAIQVVVTANGQVKSIDIQSEILADKEALEDFLIITLNKALGKAKAINEEKLASVAKEGMPNIPGMDFFK